MPAVQSIPKTVYKVDRKSVPAAGVLSRHAALDGNCRHPWTSAQNQQRVLRRDRQTMVSGRWWSHWRHHEAAEAVTENLWQTRLKCSSRTVASV